MVAEKDINHILTGIILGLIIMKKLWVEKYSNYFLNVVIPVDKAKIKNGCLYVGKNVYKLGKNYISIVRSLSNYNYIIPKSINKIKYHPIEMDVGDILLFDWKCPH